MGAQQTWAGKYGTWAAVTGATDGIGREIAAQLAEAGLNLVLVARRRPLLEKIAAQLQQSFGIETYVIGADLSQPDAAQQLGAATSTLDVGLLVAAAGFGTTGRFVDADLEDELAMLDLNCRTVVSLSHHYAKRFAARRRGGIVLFSSLVAFQGVPFTAHYAATKAFIQTLAEGLHYELAPLGVDVLASAPGPVNSGFATRANMQMSMALDPVTVARETLKALGRRGTVRPGLLSKMLIGSLSLLPRGLRVRAMAQIMRRMTQHQLTTSAG